MSSQLLRDARQHEEIFEKNIGKEDRPAFHLSSRVGWMNDPNGFSRYNGEYHLFYQYYPYAPHWDSMHWGHAVSRDLLHWEYLPASLAPDTKYDNFGCFSGSAIEMPDGKQLIMYTGVVKEMNKEGIYTDVQTQCIAVGDGINYEKYENNPVLDEKDLPEGGSRVDFRDPKMWRNEDGTLSCVVANRAYDHTGSLLIFNSENGFDWKYEKTLAFNHGKYGSMWECPDYFEMNGKHVLLLSPQDMYPVDMEYHNGNGTVCLIGHIDDTTGEFVEEYNQAIDYGIDFYAPQTILTEDGRRVMIGWMQNWDTCSMHSEDRAWVGQMSIPREIDIQNGRLLQKPIRELENLRTDCVTYQNVKVSGVQTLEKVNGRCIDMEVTIRPEDKENLFRELTINLAQDDKFKTSISYRPQEAILKIDRKFSGSTKAVIHQRRAKVYSQSEELKLRIIMDRYSVEIFVNDGEQVMTATIYTRLSAQNISFQCDGAAMIDVTKYDLTE